MSAYTSFRTIPKWPYLLLFVLSFIYYGNAIKNGFSMDDDLVTSTHEYTHKNVEKGFAGIIPIFKSRYTTNLTQNYEYRPVTTSTFAIQYAFFGDRELEEQAKISHIISVLLYGLCCVLAFILTYKLIPDKKLAVATVVSILFLIHPLHTEVVDNIKCRDELLVMLFGFSGLLLYYSAFNRPDITPKSQYVLIILGTLAIILAILSKRSGFVFIALIPLMLYFFSHVKAKQIGITLGFMLLALVIFILQKKLLFDEKSVRELYYFENPLYVDGGLMKRIPMFFFTIVWYLKMLIYPSPLSFYYGYDQIPIADYTYWEVYVGMIIVIGLTAVSIVQWSKKKFWSFGFLFFMLSIGGISNLIMVAPGIVAERFAFIPSYGFLLLIGFYGVKIYTEKVSTTGVKFAIWSVSGFLLISSLLLVIKRNTVWESHFSLYRNDIQHLNSSAKAHSLIAVEYKELADANNKNFKTYMAYTDSAIYHFEKSLEIYPQYASCLNNLAVIKNITLLRSWDALDLFKQAISHRENYHQAHHSAATCYARILKAVDFTMDAMPYIILDSTVASIQPTMFENRFPSQEIVQSAVYARFISDRVVSQLTQSGIIIYDSQHQKQLISNLKKVVNELLYLENGYLKNEFDFTATIYEPLQQALSKLKPENHDNNMLQINGGIRQVFGQYFAKLIQNDLQITTAQQADDLFFTCSLYRKTVVDSAQLYYQKAIEIAPDNFFYFTDYISFLHAEKLEDEFVRINEFAINESSIEPKSQFYMNLCTFYFYKKDNKKVKTNLLAGISNGKKNLTTIENDATSKSEQKVKRKQEIYTALKTFYDIAYQIYTAEENYEEAKKYSILINELNN
jgi:protein O-mannosyl-transferase